MQVLGKPARFRGIFRELRTGFHVKPVNRLA